MKKDKMIETLEDLIKISEKGLDPINKAIKDCADSPRVLDILNNMYGERVRSIACLQELKKDVEDWSQEAIKANMMFGVNASMPYGIVLEAEEEKE